MSKFSFQHLKPLVIIPIILLMFFINPTTNFFTTITGTTYLPHELHSQLTGSAALTDTTVYDVYGTDLGIIFKHNSKYHYLFGDTFGNSGLNWRSNTIAFSTDTNPSNGISLDGWIPNPTTGYAKELISSLKVDNIEITCIPTTALSHEGIIYIYYMSVRHWGVIGGVWQCNNASIAISTDNGYNFLKMSNISWPGTSNFVQFGYVQDQGLILTDGYFYFLATPSGRYGACYLCRVPEDSLLNLAAYEYFIGTDLSDSPLWSNFHSEAVEIFSQYVGELSVMWNDFLNKWTAFYFDNIKLDIVLRTADNLWGPWSSPYSIVGAGEYPSLYGSYVHPDLVENSGEEVYFIMSKFDVYNTFVLSVDLTSLLSITTPAFPIDLSILAIIAIFLIIHSFSTINKKLKTNKF